MTTLLRPLFVLLAMFGWAIEPSVADDSDYDPPAGGDTGRGDAQAASDATKINAQERNVGCIGAPAAASANIRPPLTLHGQAASPVAPLGRSCSIHLGCNLCP